MNYIIKSQQKKHNQDFFIKRNETEEEFSSYFKQLELIKKFTNKSWKILEIWPWSYFIYDYLIRRWFNVETFDYNENLLPDYVWDVRNFNEIIKWEYDTIAAFEIFEHIPYKDFIWIIDPILNKCKRLIFSVPYRSIHLFTFLLKIYPPILSRFKIINWNKFTSIWLSLPYYTEHKYDWAHYWELWKKGYLKNKIIDDLSKIWNIVDNWVPLLHNNHLFFVIEKWNNNIA